MTDSTEIPSTWLETFDGNAVDTKLNVSAFLSTVGADHWPHVSFLSVGEVLVGPRSLKLMLWPSSNAATNILRDRRAAFFAVSNGVVWEARLDIVADVMAEVGLLMFDASVVQTRKHHAPYAEVEGLISFRLLQIQETLARWDRQITCLRNWT